MPTDTTDIPTFRAAVFAEVVRIVMVTPGSLKACTVCEQVTKALGLPEEECGLEIFAAIFLLVRSGLVHSRTGRDTAPRIAAETELTASPNLIRFAWADPVLDEEAA